MPDPYAAEWATADTQPRPFRFIAASEMPVNPIAWLVRDYLERGTFAVLYGAAGKGKSFFALDLSCCVASGKAFHGFEVQQGAVFYIAGEGHGGVSRRLRAWAVHNGKPILELPIFVSEGVVDLALSSEATHVSAEVQRLSTQSGTRPTLIVIDTLARNFGGDENSATGIGRFVRQVDLHLRHAWEATVLIIHHSGKDSERGARGSSALKGAADAEYEMSRPTDEACIRLTPRKMKDVGEPLPLAFRLLSVDILDDAGGPLKCAVLQRADHEPASDAVVVGLGKNQQTLLLILRQMQQEIAERLARQGRAEQQVLILQEDWRQRCQGEGMPRNRFKDARDALVRRGEVRLEWPHVFC
ncbi:MAG: AAA family ATPase [Pseudomonadota bacterium]